MGVISSNPMSEIAFSTSFVSVTSWNLIVSMVYPFVIWFTSLQAAISPPKTAEARQGVIMDPVMAASLLVLRGDI